MTGADGGEERAGGRGGDTGTTADRPAAPAGGQGRSARPDAPNGSRTVPADAAAYEPAPDDTTNDNPSTPTHTATHEPAPDNTTNDNPSTPTHTATHEPAPDNTTNDNPGAPTNAATPETALSDTTSSNRRTPTHTTTHEPTPDNTTNDNPSTPTHTTAHGAGRGGTMTGSRRLLVAGAVVLWLLAPTSLAAARWPSWWAWIAPEQTPMTWLQSVALVVAAAGALLLAAVARHVGGSHGRVWLVLAVGLAGLAFDERFALHERIRDGYLAPRDVRAPFLPWVGPGDFLLLGVGVVGLVVLPFVWRALAGDRAARIALVAGVALAAVAVASDSIDPARWSVPAERIEQSLEEVVELGSGLCLLSAVWLYLLGTLTTRLKTAP